MATGTSDGDPFLIIWEHPWIISVRAIEGKPELEKGQVFQEEIFCYQKLYHVQSEK